MKKGAVEWEFVAKLILAAVLLVILIGIFILIKNRMYGDETSLMSGLKDLLRMK